MSRRAILLICLALIAGACGNDPPASGAPTGEPGFPVTVNGTEIPERPERIVSLSATHTEILYEIGAGSRVVATDLFSDYPAAAGETAKVDAFDLSVEAVAELDPDLVLLSFDPGNAVSGLAALGIPAVLFAPPGPTDLEGVFEEVLSVGKATGLDEAAAALVAEMDSEIGDVLRRVPQTLRPFTYYVELDPTLFTAGPGSLLDSIFGLLGMENVAGADAGPFFQFSPEALVGADPEYVFLADTLCCGESPDSFAGRPGFEQISAVRDGNVVALDDSVASRWGPRLVDLVRTIAKEVYGIG